MADSGPLSSFSDTCKIVCLWWVHGPPLDGVEDILKVKAATGSDHATKCYKRFPARHGQGIQRLRRWQWLWAQSETHMQTVLVALMLLSGDTVAVRLFLLQKYIFKQNVNLFNILIFILFCVYGCCLCTNFAPGSSDTVCLWEENSVQSALLSVGSRDQLRSPLLLASTFTY